MIWLDKGGLVVWVLLAYSVAGVAILLGRYLQLIVTRRAPLRQPVSQWPSCAEKRLLDILSRQYEQGLQSDELRALANYQIDHEMKKHETGLKTVSVLANTAPLLGLLGTIWGMIKAFQVIEQAGGKVDAMALAGGIWEAMLTTGVGLAVAIALLILLHFLESALARYHWRLHKVAARVLHDKRLLELPEEVAGNAL